MPTSQRKKRTSAVTLITTVYNREKYLAATIESILAQTDPDFRLIIWDDGSTDGSVQIARDYAEWDDRMTVVSSPFNDGPAIALKLAIEHCVDNDTLGYKDYLGCVDSDDILAPTAVAETRAVLASMPVVGMVYTHHNIINESGQITSPLGQRCLLPYAPNNLLVNFITFHFRLMRYSAYLDSGGIDTTLLAAIDYDLCLRLSEVTPIHCLPRVLYSYRIHNESVSVQKAQTQVNCAAEAVRKALKRRGLDSQYELIVNPPSRFELKLNKT
jgi:glycosyltransferase involved in cell wall biosynthesis